MYANDGVGLAANQININKRIFVVRLLWETADDEELVFINEGWPYVTIFLIAIWFFLIQIR
jgi:peptide deformylase